MTCRTRMEAHPWTLAGEEKKRNWVLKTGHTNSII
jgi:hypothetical protein